MTDLWIYPPDLREALASFGVAPRADTPPALVRDAVSDLYRYEIRELRERRRRGEVAPDDYVPAVIALRKKYWVLTLPVSGWERICRAGAR
jgi:hypothetical protein